MMGLHCMNHVHESCAWHANLAMWPDASEQAAHAARKVRQCLLSTGEGLVVMQSLGAFYSFSQLPCCTLGISWFLHLADAGRSVIFVLLWSALIAASCLSEMPPLLSPGAEPAA
jgi:hypothetical protein